MAFGEERFYGLAMQRLKLADWVKFKWRPLVWINGLLRTSLTPSSDHFVTGVINPNSPDELKLPDLASHIKQRLALQHSVLESGGFQFLGFYNGPAFGLVKNVGELWIDDRTVCLNLLLQSIAMQREKKVVAVQSLFSWRSNGSRLVTTNVAQEILEDPTIEYVSQPTTGLAELIRKHQQRVLAAEGLEAINPDVAWWRMFELVKYELLTLHQQGVLQPVNSKQLSNLMDYSQFIDFRDLVIPNWVRAPLSRQVPVLVWLAVLLSVMVDRPVFPWALVIMPVWWLVAALISVPIFRYWMKADPQDRPPSWIDKGMG